MVEGRRKDKERWMEVERVTPLPRYVKLQQVVAALERENAVLAAQAGGQVSLTPSPAYQSMSHSLGLSVPVSVSQCLCLSLSVSLS